MMRMFGGVEAVIAKAREAVWPTLSVTVAVKLDVPAAVAVPLKVPFVPRVTPDGSEPPVTAHV